MRILGVDPGVARMGYGILDVEPTPTIVAYGCLTTPARLSQPERLHLLYNQLGELVESAAPQEVAMERLFFNRNVNTAFRVGEARGIVLLLAAQHGLPVRDYTPLEIKQALAGYGRATKQQVQDMVRLLLRLPAVPQPDDAADALAVALCHAQLHRAHALLSEP